MSQPIIDFERRLNNIKKLGKKKKGKNPVLGISFIITPENIHEIGKSAVLYSSIKGLNHLRFSWMYDREGHAGLTEKQIESVKVEIDELIRVINNKKFHIFYEKDRIDLYSKPNDDFDTCYYQRFVWAIGADCLVYPCCIMKYHPEYAYADIRKMSLSKIVNNFITVTSMNSLEPAKCFPCWLRNRNKAIGKAVEEPMHANFI